MYKVLIIDDEPWSREVVKMLGAWESLKLSVVGEAEDGTEGLKRIEELSPHIVITDMRMPGIEGVELLKIINERFPPIKLVVMSGYDDFVYLKQAIRSRAVEYLLKPINQEELNDSLAQCVRELEQSQAKADMSWRTPPVFKDTATLERYLDYRQQVFGYLLELNKSTILQIFKSLGEFIESVTLETQDGSMITKIGYDFIIMLEEFVSRHEISFEHIWSEGKYQWTAIADCNPVSGVIEDIGLIYSEAIDAIEAFRKKENCLNVEDVQSYIDRHFQEPISLKTIAHHFFVSKEHLSRTFKTFAGENISDYIIRRRMEKARELIVDCGLEIKYAAQMAGYDDIAYFYRVFKKHFGMTPGELRGED